MENARGSVFSLMSKVIDNESISHEQKIQLLDELRKSRPALEDRWIYRWVIYFLGGSLMATVITIAFSILNQVSEIPDGLIAIGSGALGALSGLLANRPKSDEE